MRSVVALALVAALVPAPSPLKGDAHSQAAAEHRVQVILDRVHVPGGVPLMTFGAGLLTSGIPYPLPVSSAMAWTVTSGREELIHSFRVHPPRGFMADGPTAHFPSVGGYPADTVLFLLPAGRPSSQMQQLSLSARDMGGGKVELLAQATVAWIPRRSKAEDVPVRLTNAGLGWYPSGETTLLRRAVDAADAVRLGRALNQLPSTHQYTVRSCPPDNSAFTILTLRSASHVRVFDVPLGGCPFVTVTVDGNRQPELAGNARLLALLTQLVS